MMRMTRLMFAVGMLGVGSTLAFAEAPGSIEVVCDLDRTQFRNAARLLSASDSVTFKLWSDDTPGAPDSQIGPDYTVPLSALNVIKRYTERYDHVTPRKSARVQAAIGTDLSPVLLPIDGVAYVDMMIGTTTLGCDHAATNSPSRRRRLHSVAFAQQAGHAGSCETCMAGTDPVSARVEINSSHFIADSALTAVSWDVEKWDAGCSGGGVFDSGSPTRLTACSAGKYLVFANITWNNFVAGYRFAGLRVNGGGRILASEVTAGDAITNSDSSLTTVVELAVGDFVEVVVFQNKGTPIEVSPGSAPPADTTPAFGMTKLHD